MTEQELAQMMNYSTGVDQTNPMASLSQYLTPQNAMMSPNLTATPGVNPLQSPIPTVTSDSLAQLGGTPGVGQDGNGLNFGSLQGWGSVMGGIGSLAGAWNGLQQVRLAKDQFKFAKGMAETNLANQAAVTNQALRDRRSGRRAVFGGNKGTGAQVSGSIGTAPKRG